MKPDYTIYVVSDSLGPTAETVAKAAARQFPDKSYNLLKYPNVTQVHQVNDIIKRAARHSHSIIVFTTVLEHIRDAMVKKCERNKVAYLDIMKQALNTFERTLGQPPVFQAESSVLDESYFSRIKAIEFAIKYDDGKDPSGIKEADLVLIGISRTSKTPLSMYMAYFGKKVINIPLVMGSPVPPEIFETSRSKIVGLIIDPVHLNQIRQQRSRLIGFKNNLVYTDMHRIIEELEFSEKIMKQLGCPVINVTDKAIEETANIILNILE